MKFPYKKLRVISPPDFLRGLSYLLRPIIPVVLHYKGKSIGYEALIDSGADFCLFHADLAEYLGIPLQESNKQSFGGITGQKAAVYMHLIDLSVGGHRFSSIPVGFSHEIAPHGHGILGQHGFFDLFKVIFDLEKEQIELRPKG